LPATLTVAVLPERPEYAVRVTVNEPVPVRPVAELRLSQLDDSEADHVQVDPVVTVIVDEPDVEGSVSAVGLIV